MKPIIYQVFPRTFTNYNETRKPNGSIEENGCGKFAEITTKALQAIQDLGATHVWYTGVIRHATAKYNHPEKVFEIEEFLIDGLIPKGQFHEKANAFLFECRAEGRFSDVRHMTFSDDRYPEKAFATIIREGGKTKKVFF